METALILASEICGLWDDSIHNRLTVCINTSQPTQNKWQEEVFIVRVFEGFWKTPGYHIAATLLSVWLDLISKRGDTTSVSCLWMGVLQGSYNPATHI